MVTSSLETLLEDQPQKARFLAKGSAEDVSVNLAIATDNLYKTNRRRLPRLPVHGCKLHVRHEKGSDSNWIDTRPEDFSVDGVCFITKGLFRQDEQVTARITPDYSATALRPFEVTAIVRHFAPHGREQRVGIQFRPDLMHDRGPLGVQESLDRFSGFLKAIDGVKESNA